MRWRLPPRPERTTISHDARVGIFDDGREKHPAVFASESAFLPSHDVASFVVLASVVLQFMER
jgi:hypothetical protein